jgi:beta-phosphoglucomutase-like phosphatase (HAD superfamily)
MAEVLLALVPRADQARRPPVTAALSSASSGGNDLVPTNRTRSTGCLLCFTRPASTLPAVVRVPAANLQAVVFDLDGLLIDSEPAWDLARRQVTAEHGGWWADQATRDMMGMSSLEWSRYMHERLGVGLAPGVISARVVERMQVLYRQHLPLVPGARQSVERLARRWPLALASSSNRPVIDLVLSLAGLQPHFRATVSSEEVARGKPAPDVYLEAARRWGPTPRAAQRLRTPTTGSWPPRPPVCGCSPYPTGPSHPGMRP